MAGPAAVLAPLHIILGTIGIFMMFSDSKKATKQKRELKQNQSQMLEQGRLQRESGNPAIQEMKKRDAGGGPINTLKYQQNKRDAELIIKRNAQQRARQAQAGDLSKSVLESANQSEKRGARKRVAATIEGSQFNTRITEAAKAPIEAISTSKQTALTVAGANIDSAAEKINEEPIKFKPLQSAPTRRESINNDEIAERAEFSSLRFANRRIIENKKSGLADDQKAVVAAIAAMNENTIKANTRSLQRKIASLDNKIEKLTYDNRQTSDNLNKNTQETLGQVDSKTTQNIKMVSEAQGSSAKVVIQSTQAGINEMYGKLAEKEKENNIKTLAEINMGNANIADTIEGRFGDIERTDADYRLNVEQQRMADLQWMEEGKAQDVSDRQMMMEQMEGLDRNQTSLFEKVKTVAANVNPEAMENKLNQAGGGLGSFIGKVIAFSATVIGLGLSFVVRLPELVGAALAKLFNAIKDKVKDLTLDALKTVFIKAPKKLLLSLLKIVPGMDGIVSAYEKIFGKDPDRDKDIEKAKKSTLEKISGLISNKNNVKTEKSKTLGDMSDMFKAQERVGEHVFDFSKIGSEAGVLPVSEMLTTKRDSNDMPEKKGAASMTSAVAAATGVLSSPINFATKFLKRKGNVTMPDHKEEIMSMVKEGSVSTNKQIGDVMGVVGEQLNTLTTNVELISQKQDMYAEISALAAIKTEASLSKKENPTDMPSRD